MVTVGTSPVRSSGREPSRTLALTPFRTPLQGGTISGFGGGRVVELFEEVRRLMDRVRELRESGG